MGSEDRTSMTTLRLVGDVGGTNVRFAVADARAVVRHIRSYRTALFGSFEDALEHYLAEAWHGSSFATCAIGAAGPVDGGSVRLTNGSWVISADRVSSQLAGARVEIVNDLEAVAAALPGLPPAAMASLGGVAVTRPATRTMLALNVGTGFGASAVVHRGGRWWTVPSEARHMTLGLAAPDEREWLTPGASIESALSGPGVARMYARLTGVPEAKSVVLPPVRGPRGPETGALDAISRLLGRVAGDLVLATAAWGGVYLCGSVAVAWAAIADPHEFRAAFERKGPMRERMQSVPSAVILAPDAALLGLAAMPIAGAEEIETSR